ncbi:AAA family ATPase [Streptomyces sp. NRRL B-1677]|uniref:AAA family ATPase n=1 Tax=Streptomyces sp. NRRL B-1677 TaxID=2682966 RepID=UPI001892CE4D|nr:ATP-binding protein [Streptomyces sp. NRRL B-1677]MBF6047984.1 AAA family ATPase [Streptomyces sp. NRRL B-1677]
MLTTSLPSSAVWDAAGAAEPFAVLDDAAPPLHYHQTTGLRTLLTPGMLAVGDALADAYAQGRFVCVLGDAGVGKTFAVHTAARRLGELLLLPLYLRAQPTPADLRACLHKALKLRGEPPADPGAADAWIRRALALKPHIVVVEDAHRLSASSFEYLRFLHDDTPGGLCVVLIAETHGERRLRAQRMLATRTAGWPYIWPLTRDQVPKAVAALHPVWQSVAPDDLKALDARIADGALRRWAVLTVHTQRALAATGASKPDWGMLEAVADRVDGGRRP